PLFRSGAGCPPALPPRGRCRRGAAGRRARGPPALRVGGASVPEHGRGARAADRHGALEAQSRPSAPARTARGEREKEGEIPMKPVDLARKLRREAAFEPAALDRGKEALMAAIRQEVQPRRPPTIVPRLPYEDGGGALSFLEGAAEWGGRGARAPRGAFSPKGAGPGSQYITVHVDDIDAHHRRALASGAE